MKVNRAAKRALLIAERRAISPQLRKEWDKSIADQVVAWCRANAVRTAGVYSPIQGEPSLYEAFPLLTEIGIQLALPSVPGKEHPLTFLAWKPGDELMKDRFGVLVPLKSAAEVKPDVLFIPCVGYTANGYRLGYGGGYYDRTLAGTFKPKAVGIAYRISHCEIEPHPHDIPLDFIIINR